MSNLKWWQKTIVYELYPSSFKDSNNDGIGDLKGIVSKLDYLKSLNVGAIWLTPVYASPMVDNGYDISDYYSIDPRFGTMEDMDELIKEANKRNIKIVMDLVFNHTSDKCKWFLESKKSKDNKYSDWYIWRDPNKDGSAPTNWRSIFNGSAWEYVKERDQYYLHTFFKEQPDINWENKDVRKALFDVANFWVNKGVGGFRIDAITFIKKPKEFVDGKVDGADGLSPIADAISDTPGILDFLNEFKHNVQDGTDIFTVAEANGVSIEELPGWVGKTGAFDMIFRFDLVNIEFVNGEVWYDTKKCKIKEFKQFIVNEQNEIEKGLWCPIFFENHDRPRSINHFLENDNDYVNKSKALLTLLFTLRGTPFLYQGEELGITNVEKKSVNDFDDGYSRNQYYFAIENGKSKEEALACVNRYSRDNTRGPIPWDSTENGGFSSVKPWLPAHDKYEAINVESEEKDSDSPLMWSKYVSTLRLNNPVLVDGKFEELLHDDENIFAYRRTLEDKEMLIIVNLSNNVLDVPSIITSYKLIKSSHNKHEDSKILPYEALIYSK